MLIFVSALLLLISSGCIRLPEGWGIITPTNNTTAPCPQPPGIADAVRLSCEQQGGDMEPLYDAKSCVIGHRCYMPPQQNNTNITNATQRCGGPFGIQCPDGYECSAEGTAYGDCVEKLYENTTCWGYERTSCPAGHYCELGRDFYGIKGSCVKITNETYMWCGGYADLECPKTYYCRKEEAFMYSTGMCIPTANAVIRCGGPTLETCPEGMTCVLDPSNPGAAGKCVSGASAKDPRSYCFTGDSGAKISAVNDCGTGVYRLWQPSLSSYSYVDSSGTVLADCTSEAEDEECMGLNSRCKVVVNTCSAPSAGLKKCSAPGACDTLSPVCALLVNEENRLSWRDSPSECAACTDVFSTKGFKNGTCSETSALSYCAANGAGCISTRQTVCGLVSIASGSYWKEFNDNCAACSAYRLVLSDTLNPDGTLPEAPPVQGEVLLGYKPGNCAGTQTTFGCPNFATDSSTPVYSPSCGMVKLGSDIKWKDYASPYAACAVNSSAGSSGGYRSGYC